MDKYNLPTSTIIDGKVCKFNSDYRDIINIFNLLNDPDLLPEEKGLLSLELFYQDDNYKVDIKKALDELFFFITMGDDESNNNTSRKPLYDWDNDFSLIVAPVNKILGKDVRGIKYLHWWTFLSAFMEIGECTFSTYVGIRDKLNKGKKLEKYEEQILRDNRDKIILKKKYDATTQELMDEVMGNI